MDHRLWTIDHGPWSKSINESIVCAGFGGQGVMVLGKFFAIAGMEAGLYVTWLPAYGAEVRGGTAHSFIRLSSSPIGDPMVTEPKAAVIMNTPSLEKFEKKMIPGGLLILNTSIVERKSSRKDIDIVECQLTDEAMTVGNVKAANIIAAGIYLAKKNIFSKDLVLGVIKKMAGGRDELARLNSRAVERGYEIGAEVNVGRKT
ncbi:MAG: 2-oxoacid:acceptor oxidoreductase family protein [Candidatus Omnitrophica bacterium]|nr:2-oxoacid:acceptor oxidoreductase family protein [Candidatus Omnitrophota bacterium]